MHGDLANGGCLSACCRRALQELTRASSCGPSQAALRHPLMSRLGTGAGQPTWMAARKCSRRAVLAAPRSTWLREEPVTCRVLALGQTAFATSVLFPHLPYVLLACPVGRVVLISNEAQELDAKPRQDSGLLLSTGIGDCHTQSQRRVSKSALIQFVKYSL